MIEATSGGCCTPYPFEAAIWLWEETEELYGGLLPNLPKSMSGDLHAMASTRVSWCCVKVLRVMILIAACIRPTSKQCLGCGSAH